ncbi:hypothetical protein BX600DRAFT_197852 [Xylariales sp. PMI_506]|nr:hypothetical protein BX600DRAFT_197852 [Xylariales sp. PMI_506]
MTGLAGSLDLMDPPVRGVAPTHARSVGGRMAAWIGGRFGNSQFYLSSAAPLHLDLGPSHVCEYPSALQEHLQVRLCPVPPHPPFTAW